MKNWYTLQWIKDLLSMEEPPEITEGGVFFGEKEEVFQKIRNTILGGLLRQQHLADYGMPEVFSLTPDGVRENDASLSQAVGLFVRRLRATLKSELSDFEKKSEIKSQAEEKKDFGQILKEGLESCGKGFS